MKRRAARLLVLAALRLAAVGTRLIALADWLYPTPPPKPTGWPEVVADHPLSGAEALTSIRARVLLKANDGKASA